MFLGGWICGGMSVSEWVGELGELKRWISNQNTSQPITYN